MKKTPFVECEELLKPNMKSHYGLYSPICLAICLNLKITCKPIMQAIEGSKISIAQKKLMSWIARIPYFYSYGPTLRQEPKQNLRIINRLYWIKSWTIQVWLRATSYISSPLYSQTVNIFLVRAVRIIERVWSLFNFDGKLF